MHVLVPARMVMHMAGSVIVSTAVFVSVFERVQFVVERVIDHCEGDRIEDRQCARRQRRLCRGGLDGRGWDAVPEQGEGFIEERGGDRMPVEVLDVCYVGGVGHRNRLWAATGGDSPNDIARGVDGLL